MLNVVWAQGQPPPPQLTILGEHLYLMDVWVLPHYRGDVGAPTDEGLKGMD